MQESEMVETSNQKISHKNLSIIMGGLEDLPPRLPLIPAMILPSLTLMLVKLDLRAYWVLQLPHER